jgi:ferric-dicitrate binding protein FerR (iron transport regulator)
MKDEDEELARKERRRRNVVLALSLGALAVLFYLMSVVKWQHFGQ